MNKPELKFLFLRSPAVISTLFVGLGGFGAFIEAPARRRLDEASQLKEWADSFIPSLYVQSALGMSAAIGGLANYYVTKNPYYGIGGAIFLAIFPYTLLRLKPLFTELLEADANNKPEGTRKTVEEWVRRHAWRVVLGAVATGLFLVGEFKEKIGN